MAVQAILAPRSINIFISFAPTREKTLLHELVEFLSPLSRQDSVNLWYDEQMQGGLLREEEITRQLQAAQIILLLVSPACVASSYWYQQMEAIMERAKSGGVSVVPVLLRPTVAWQETPFGQFAPLPDDKPITAFNTHDVGWYKVAKGVHALIAHLQQTPPVAVARQLRMQPPMPHPARVQRPQLVTEIYQRLTGSDVSTLVLTGIGGIGKSTLATQVCHFAEEQRRAGQGPFLAEALWLDIDATTSLLDVFGSLCEAYGIALPSFQMMTVYDLIVELFKVLHNSNQPRLIVLNQFENWLNPQTRYPRAEHPGVGELLELLDSQACASRILLTSRIYPHGKSQHLDAYVQKFALPGLTLTEGLALLHQGKSGGTEEELASAVTYYQGHPLALALLRDLLRDNLSLSPSALLYDIAYKQLWIDDMAENVLNYMYTQQLSQEQRDLLWAFSIYRQAVPLPAAQRITNSSARQTSAALRVLIDQDLLQATGNREYRLQPVIKDFVQAQVGENDPHGAEEQRHQAHRIAAVYYQDQFSSASSRTLQPYMDDFRLLLEAAWHHCQAGQFAEAYHLIQHEKLFSHLHRWGGNSLLLDLYQHLLPPEEWSEDVVVAGQIYHEIGEIQNALGQKQEAQSYYERALTLFRQSKQPVLIAEALNNLGTMYRILKQEERAKDCYEEAWSICEQVGEGFTQRGITLNNMGRLLYEQGQHKQQSRQKDQAYTLYLEALTRYEQALVEHRSNNLPEEEGWTRINLGDVYTTLGQRSDAHDHYMQALKLFQDAGERRGEGTVLNNLGVLFTYEREGKQKSATYYRKALRIFRTVGDHWQERKTLRNLGRWLIVSALEQEAVRSLYYTYGLACFFCARDVLEEQHNRHYEMIPGWLLASLRLDLGDQQMEELFKEVEARSTQIIEELLNSSHDFDTYGGSHHA